MENNFKPAWLTPRVFLLLMTIVLTSLVHYGAYRINYLSEKIDKKEKMIESLNDTLKIKGNTASTSRVEVNNIKEINNTKSNDSLVLQLQSAIERLSEEVKKNGSSITAFEAKLKASQSSKTDVSYRKDSTPVYKSHFKDEWIDLKTVADKDTTTFDLSVTNKYNVMLGYERTNIFKKPKPIVKIEDLNTHSKVTGIKSVSVKDERPKVEFKWNVGAGAHYDIFSQRFGFGPYGGFGLTF